jgi:tetratricopeptide (TPR) repeat protein
MGVAAFASVRNGKSSDLRAEGPAFPADRTRAQLLYIDSLMSRALQRYEAGQFAEAEPLCLKILAVDVHHADALYVLGMAAFRTGRHALAERMIRRAIAVNSRQPFYHSNLGNALQAQGKLDQAIACYNQALFVSPGHVEASFNLGNVYATQKKYDEAVACFRQALAVKPDYPDAWCNLGNVFKAQGKLDEAVDCYRHAVALRPDHADLFCNLGDALHLLGNVDEAVACFQSTLRLNPNHAKAFNCLGNAFFDLGDLTKSKAHCARAVELKPDFYDAQMNVSLLQLLHGDYLSGWRKYEVRWKVYPKRFFDRPLWQGAADPDGPDSPNGLIQGKRILVHAEQGLGDTLQFLRYVPLIQAAGGEVILDVPPAMRRIASQIAGLAALVSTGDPLPPFDFHCPLMSLPQAFATTVETIPARVPYLTVPEDALKAASALPWPARGLRIGLVWAGNPSHPKDRARSIPLARLEPLFGIEGAHMFSLQLGPAAAQLAATRLPITDLTPAIHDMADTAALMANLDLIISVDTSPVHLAGALAMPTWLLLPHSPDWRWLIDRADSPWYPTVQLFRQPAVGDWKSVVDALQGLLTEKLAQLSM